MLTRLRANFFWEPAHALSDDQRFRPPRMLREFDTDSLVECRCDNATRDRTSHGFQMILGPARELFLLSRVSIDATK